MTTATLTNKTLVRTAIHELFDRADPSAVDRYWSPEYRQHSALAADGPDGLRQLAANLPEEFRYELHRLLGEEDLVVTHGVYHGLAPDPLVAFDLWRVADGAIVEHWDALQTTVAQTASGRSQTDGPAEVTAAEATAANRTLVERFVQTVLIEGRLDQLASFFDGDAYIQHNPLIPDNVSGLRGALADLARQGVDMAYSRRHRTVADGEFVFTQSEGVFGGRPYAFYDLFRVADGAVAEHWDVMVEQAAELPHGNGLF